MDQLERWHEEHDRAEIVFMREHATLIEQVRQMRSAVNVAVTSATVAACGAVAELAIRLIGGH